MALQSSGQQISFGNIVTEFGTPTNKNIGAYRVSETIGALSNMPLDTGVPQTGQIAFSDFYGKQLNVVVDFYTGGAVTRQTARTKYDNKNVRVIGGFKNRPSSASGTRVIIHVNKTIGSAKGSRTYVALKTGSWESNTNLDLFNYGNIYGAGGNGGNGGNRSRGPSGGSEGSSALGLSYPTQIWNYGNIYGGGNGGSGGSGGRRDDRRRYRCGWWCEGRDRDRRRTGGGGGGGGQGYPGGSGGDGGGSGGGPGGGGSTSGAGGGGGGGSGASNGSGGGGWGAGRAILMSGSGYNQNVVIGNRAGGEEVSGFS